MRPTTFLPTFLCSALLVTCGCQRVDDAVGPPLLPLPPPAGCGNTGAGVCYHVATTGNDANPGTAAQPFRTIQHAADIVNAGDGVLVENGVYTGGSTVVYINRNGTETNRIVFRAANRWGAIIDGNNNASTTGIAIPGAFVWVEGFEVRNTSRYGIDTDVGHDQVVMGNHVHDIGRICTGSTGGIVGIDAYASGLVIAGNWVHDVGRFGPGEDPSCTPPNNNWQNHDHGIYNGIGTNVLIVNNVFYNLRHGWAIQRYDGQGAVVHGLFILNNTFIGANPNRDGQVIIATPTASLVIANNIFYQPANAGVVFENAGSGGTLTGNLSTTALETGGSGLVTAGNVVADPIFVNAAALDFHLMGNSPARGAALEKWCPGIDYDGVARNGACAAGAFQN